MVLYYWALVEILDLTSVILIVFWVWDWILRRAIVWDIILFVGNWLRLTITVIRSDICTHLIWWIYITLTWIDNMLGAYSNLASHWIQISLWIKLDLVVASVLTNTTPNNNSKNDSDCNTNSNINCPISNILWSIIVVVVIALIIALWGIKSIILRTVSIIVTAATQTVIIITIGVEHKWLYLC